MKTKKQMKSLTLYLLMPILCIASSENVFCQTCPPDKDKEPAYYTTEAGVLLAPTFDWSASSCGEHSHESVRERIRLVRNMGFKRLYAVVDLPGNPVFSYPFLSPAMDGIKRKNMQNLGDDLNAVLAQACQEEGMEVIAILKPYENGQGHIVPVGAAPEETGFREKTVGGEHLFFDNFVSAHPDMRVARRNDYDADDYNLPITKIEATFSLDPYQAAHTAQGRAAMRNAPGRMTVSISDADAQTPNVHLLVSRDNGAYTPYMGKFTSTWNIERRDVHDANGIVIYENHRCNVLTIADLNIGEEYPYVAILLENSYGMSTIPFSMIHWFSGDKELKLTAATYVRQLYGEPYEWTKQKEPRHSFANYNLNFRVGSDGNVIVQTKDNYSMTEVDKVVAGFQNAGFIFSWQGVGHNGDGWRSSPVLGLARGKMPYMGGALCEAYPEVRQYWLDVVKNLLDVGYHGVDIRIQNHSSILTADYMNYGFNAPLVQRYKELYNEDINAIPMTKDVYLRLMKIRGDYFMNFLEDAAKLTKERGARFFIHLRDAFENPICDNDFNQLCHWSQPKIILDWKRCVELADEITIKDYYYKKYNPASAQNTKDYAASLGKRVWIHCYVTQGDDLDEPFLLDIQKDERISGILFYDLVNGNIGKMSGSRVLENLKYQYRGPSTRPKQQIVITNNQ